MPANTTPIYVGTPKTPQIRFSTANTARDGTGTLATGYTAGANGDIFKGLHFQPETAPKAGDIVRYFVQIGGSGNNELRGEFLVPLANPAASASNAIPAPIPPVDIYPPDGIVLGAGDIVKYSTDQGVTYNGWLSGGGDY